MLNIGENSLKTIRQQTEQALEGMAQGTSIRDILCQLYVAGLPDKAENQGYLMADYVIQIVTDFTIDCGAAMENMDQWLQEKLEGMLEGKNREERCQVLFQLIGALHAVNAAALRDHLSDADMDATEMLATLGERQLDPEAINEGLEAELFEEALKALGNSGLMLTRLDTLADLLQQQSESDDLSRMVVDFGAQTADYKAVAAMVAYVAAKNGSLEDVPPEIGIEEIAVGVCVGVETQRVAAQVAEGSLTESAARLILKALGVVATAWLLAYAFTFSLALAASLIQGAAAVILGVSVGALFICFVAPGLLRQMDEASDFVAHCLAVPVNALLRGLRRVAAWAEMDFMPQTIAALERGMRFVADLLSRGIAVITRSIETVIQSEV